jgi:hypothetical protein
MSKSCAEKRSSVLLPPLATSFLFSGSLSCSLFGVTVIAASMASLLLSSSSYGYNNSNILSKRTTKSDRREITYKKKIIKKK